MKRPTIRKWSLFIMIFLMALGIIGRPVYRQYREHNALRHAQRFATKGDFRNASLSARRAVQLNDHNVEACRILCRLTEAAGSPEALDWYSRVAQLNPTVENKLALAAQALRLQDPPYLLASELLQEMAASATGRVCYCMLSAELALKLGEGGRAAEW